MRRAFWLAAGLALLAYRRFQLWLRPVEPDDRRRRVARALARELSRPDRLTLTPGQCRWIEEQRCPT